MHISRRAILQRKRVAKNAKARTLRARGNSPAESPKRSKNYMAWAQAGELLRAIQWSLHVKACERHGVSLALKPIKSKRTAKRKQPRM